MRKEPRELTPAEAGALCLERTENGKVANTMANYKRVLQSDPLLKGAICKNLLTGQVDVVKPLGWYRESSTLSDVDIKYLLMYFEETYGLVVEKKLQDAVMVAANENRYHPIRHFLNSLVWDGEDRIRHCLHRFLGADEDAYTEEALRLFLLGAISRVFEPGCKFELMLCLVGGQGSGKSSFFRLLAGRDDWFSDDLKRLDDENVYRKMQGHWIIERSEMIAAANAKSIEEIKAFLSRQKETYKVPYETHPADRLRQCVFCGSSNTMDFLPLDRTGNRRFVPVLVHPERAEIHVLEDEAASRAYLAQVWAQAMEVYRSGSFRLCFSREMEDYLRRHQRDFMPEDTKAGLIADYLDRCKERIVCSRQLFREALGRGTEEPKQRDIREINDIMNNTITGWKAFSTPPPFPQPLRTSKRLGTGIARQPGRAKRGNERSDVSQRNGFRGENRSSLPEKRAETSGFLVFGNGGNGLLAKCLLARPAKERFSKLRCQNRLPASNLRGGCQWRQFSRGAIESSRSPSATGTAPEDKSGCRAAPSTCPGRSPSAACCNTSTPRPGNWRSGFAAEWRRTTAPPLNSTPRAGWHVRPITSPARWRDTNASWRSSIPTSAVSR